MGLYLSGEIYRYIPDLYDLYDLYDLAHAAGWKQYIPHCLQQNYIHPCWVAHVLRASSTQHIIAAVWGLDKLPPLGIAI